MDYSQLINPSKLTTNSKLTNYTTALLEVLTWQASNEGVAEANKAVAQAQADSIYASMTADDQAIADQNRARILQGEPYDSTTHEQS